MKNNNKKAYNYLDAFANTEIGKSVADKLLKKGEQNGSTQRVREPFRFKRT